MLPSVWPGVAMTRAPPPKSIVSPSPSSTSTGQGGTDGIPAVTDAKIGSSAAVSTGSARRRSPRTIGASARWAYTVTPSPHARNAAAEPMWSSCPWVITMRRRSARRRPSSSNAAAKAGSLPGIPVSTRVTPSSSRQR